MPKMPRSKKENKKLEQINNTKLKTKKKSKNTTGLQFPFQIQKRGTKRQGTQIQDHWQTEGHVDWQGQEAQEGQEVQEGQGVQEAFNHSKASMQACALFQT